LRIELERRNRLLRELLLQSLALLLVPGNEPVAPGVLELLHVPLEPAVVAIGRHAGDDLLDVVHGLRRLAGDVDAMLVLAAQRAEQVLVPIDLDAGDEALRGGEAPRVDASR